jgi:hypothetical protein
MLFPIKLAMKILLFLFLPCFMVAQEMPEGWLSCEVQRDSLLQRLGDEMEQLNSIVRYQPSKLASAVSYRLKYQQHLIEGGHCLTERGTNAERWIPLPHSYQRETTWLLQLLQEEQDRKGKRKIGRGATYLSEFARGKW